MAHYTNNRCEEAEPDLISEARNGDERAMAELFRRHYTHSIAVARRLLPAQEEFLDAVQSAYLSAFRNFQSFRAESSFKTWITRIVRNQCLMRLREPVRCARVLSLDQPDDSGPRSVIAADSPTPEQLVLRGELERAVADATADLPKRLNDGSLVTAFRGSRLKLLRKRSASRCRRRKAACSGRGLWSGRKFRPRSRAFLRRPHRGSF